MSSKPTEARVATTAGLRGASWSPARMELPFKARPYALITVDKAPVQGVLYSRGASDKVLVVMHPREFVMTHYLVPDALEAGWACWVQAPRSIGSDLRLEHEAALLDVAAGMSHLRALGFKKIVLLGNSGGAGLFAYYNQQSLLAPSRRIVRAPGGRPYPLDKADMPTADGLALVSPHPGQGILLMNGLDPSVVDEGQPFEVDAALNPFSEGNGFRAPPASSHYADSFVQRYRHAQKVRVARIDQMARDLIAQRQEARSRVKSTGDTAARQLAHFGPILTLWRTDADLRCWDTGLDPSDRLVGSLWGADPYTSNYGQIGFGRLVTPESWLSTWSGLSSNASLDLCAPSMEQPTLLIEYTGDNCVFPTDADTIFAAIRGGNKQRLRVRGNHHGQPLEPDEPSGQLIAGKRLQDWLRETFS